MIPVQEWIHKLEEGEGSRWIKLGAFALLILALTTAYDMREYHNLSSPEAMEAAQIARNLAQGRGFTTDCIRPLAFHLLQRQTPQARDLLKRPLPDLTHAPLYPLALAGLIKVVPFTFVIPPNTFAARYQPEMFIAFFNQGLFFVSAWILFRLARRLFDSEVAWISTLLFLGADLFWRFSVSGLPILLALVFMLALLSLVVRIEQGARENTLSLPNFIALAVGTGLLLGLATLTRYALGWFLLPLLGYLAWISGPRRWIAGACVTAVFLICVGPWVARNLALSGQPFGTATFAAIELTEPFPTYQLQRSLLPEFNRVTLESVLRKLMENSAEIVQSDLPRLGGSWVSAFFLVGFLVPFVNPGLQRFRFLLLLLLACAIPVQALGKTQLSVESPLINGENLLVLFAPLAFVFGTALFLTLLDQIQLPSIQLRPLCTASFTVAGCAGLIFTLLPPRGLLLAYPPYFPPLIQQVAHWMREDELMMSDIPWAVAWYGQRTCMWTVLDVERDFYAIDNWQRPVKGLYLTQVTTDAKLFSETVRPKARGWEWFIFQSLTRTNLPPGFPLKNSLRDLLNEGQVFLTDHDRWARPAKP